MDCDSTLGYLRFIVTRMPLRLLMGTLSGGLSNKIDTFLADL